MRLDISQPIIFFYLQSYVPKHHQTYWWGSGTVKFPIHNMISDMMQTDGAVRAEGSIKG